MAPTVYFPSEYIYFPSFPLSSGIVINMFVCGFLFCNFRFTFMFPSGPICKIHLKLYIFLIPFVSMRYLLPWSLICCMFFFAFAPFCLISSSALSLKVHTRLS